jgi:diguanylate cyclase (GGDEF)-like protein/hemerythrin-like metal-binding protein
LEQLVLDNRTIIAILALGNVASPLLMLALKGEIRKTAHYRLFLLGKAHQAIAWGLIYLCGLFRYAFIAEIGSTLALGGLALEAWVLSTIRLTPRESQRWIKVYAGLATAGAALVWLLPATLAGRDSATSLAIAAILLTAAMVLFAFPPRERIALAMGALYACASAVLAIRGWIGFSQPGISLRANGAAQSAAFVSLFFLMLMGSIFLLLILKERLVRQLEAERNRAELIAVTDPLTGLNNRRLFDERLMAEFYRLKRSGAPLSLVMIDVDHFKIYNDMLGHPKGDECLRKVSAAIAGSARRLAECAARYGGEEFTVIIPEAERDGALAQAERIRRAVEDLAIPHPSGGVVTVSLGVVTALPSLMLVPDGIVEQADKALYKAKGNGRNRVESMTPELDESDIRGGLVRLSWRAADECGQCAIDADHKGLIERANFILAAIMEHRPRSELASLLLDFVERIAEHFRNEEAIIGATPYPKTSHHASLHADLLTKAREMLAFYDEGKIGIGELFGFVAYDVILRHMQIEDKDFFPYLGIDGRHP